MGDELTLYRKRHLVEVKHETETHLIYLTRNYLDETIGTPVLMEKHQFREQYEPCEHMRFPINNAIVLNCGESEAIRIDGTGRFYVNGRLVDVDTPQGVQKLYQAMYDVYYTQKKPNPAIKENE